MKLQSSFRGLNARNAQQETARLQWLQYYMLAEVGEWDQALTLCVTPQEEATVHKAKRAAQSTSDIEEEARRVKWLKYHLVSSDFDRAAELVTTRLEAASLLKARVMSSKGWCKCLCTPGAAQADAERKEQFVAAIKAYDWEVAEVLAISAEELQDFADSKLRVSELQKAVAEGKHDLAMQYAITAAEEERIEAASKAAGGKLGPADGDKESMGSPPPASNPVDSAAVKVQAIFRGHQTRDTQEETRRVEWLRYFAAEGQYEKALELAVTKAEVDAIDILKAEAATKESRAPPPATPLAEPTPTTPQAATAPTSQPEVKVAQPTPPAAASGPAEPPDPADAFKAAIRAYDWEAAEALASSDAERQDIKDSKLRVGWLKKYSADGQYDKAKELAITEAELADIENVEGAKATKPSLS